MKQVELDKLDQRILVILQQDGRISNQQLAEQIEQQVSSYPEVLQCFAVTGNADFVLRVIVPDMASYDRFLNEKIFTLQGIAQVNSNFALREIKNTQTIPLGSA
ncbi:AsnC-like helix-turn-helix protein [Marinobacter sp. LV10R520-4]|uniref:Lrp/AsnC family transcriptional regulator n=1 Tax=Marinobacter sp. LV10R520-4 TaxID=1761796 RepID=UPI000BF3980C|nr:Lrp/AsnC ligand binding domain-containing protein [Marinobacter sp. LV10R520-4]PFG52101.1 AsnC-like helix-turn-helix protein [Marinobacter sp. LV10R520-4]